MRDHLEDHFGASAVFQDITIEPGEDYREAIRRELATCYAVLVVIGPRWLIVSDDEGRRRIDNPRDALRREVQFALDHDPQVRVIPVLVDGASLPDAFDLPEAIHRLAYRIAFELRSTRWRDDMLSLIERLERPREDRFAWWSDIRPAGFPVTPLIFNAALRPYGTNLLAPVGLVVAGFIWSSWLWLVAAALYGALTTITLFDLQQARCVRDFVDRLEAKNEEEPAREPA
jgi:TIR domain